MIAPQTWPTWRGSDRDGVVAILNHLGVSPGEYELGRTKLFIKEAKTVSCMLPDGLHTDPLTMRLVYVGGTSAHGRDA